MSNEGNYDRRNYLVVSHCKELRGGPHRGSRGENGHRAPFIWDNRVSNKSEKNHGLPRIRKEYLVDI